jgi:hypothetical protein
MVARNGGDIIADAAAAPRVVQSNQPDRLLATTVSPRGEMRDEETAIAATAMRGANNRSER